MQAYLGLPELGRPRIVFSSLLPEDPAPPPSGRVRVKTAPGTGEAFLAGGTPRVVQRLTWLPRDEEHIERPLPPGAYEALGYRHVREAADGTRWMLSTTSTGYRPIEVRAEEATPLPISAEVRVTVRAQRHRGRLHVSVAVQGDDGIGCSIYRVGVRIPLAWRALDAAGKVLAEGPLRYG